MGPTVTRWVQDGTRCVQDLLAVLNLNNRLYIPAPEEGLFPFHSGSKIVQFSQSNFMAAQNFFLHLKHIPSSLTFFART